MSPIVPDLLPTTSKFSHSIANFRIRKRRQRRANTNEDLKVEGDNFLDSDDSKAAAAQISAKRLHLAKFEGPSVVNAGYTTGLENVHAKVLPARVKNADEAGSKGKYRPRASARKAAKTATVPRVAAATCASSSAAPTSASSRLATNAQMQDKTSYRKILLKRLLRTLEVFTDPSHFPRARASTSLRGTLARS